MRYNIEDLKDITDSREIMQSSPKGFSKYMTYIILALLIVVVIWSLMANKELSVRASGVVRPGNEINKVSSGIMGNITNLNIKDGDKVKEGDILVVVNGAEYVFQKNLYEENLERKNKDIELLEKLKESILEDKNKFNINDETEKSYYNKFELYSENVKIGNSQELIQENQKDEINKTISELNLLKKGIEEEKNYFDSNSHLYYQYRNYEMELKNYKDAISSYEEKVKSLKENIIDENKEQILSDVAKLEESIGNSKREFEKLKNTAIMNVASEISQNESKLGQIGVTTGSGSYKEQYLTNIESNITSTESVISDIKMNLEAVSEKVNATSIKAPCDGIVNMLADIKIGDFIQNGTQIASIVPEDDLNYIIETYIDSKSFGEIKDGQDVIIELVSLPGREYGYLKSNLNNISVDAKVSQEKGTSYYTAKSPINKTTLNNKKGESIDIKNGMLAEVRILNRRVSYFRYFLEKISILD